MLYNNILEPMPSKKVSFKKQKDYLYVYYVTRSYRNKHGNPTCDEVMIGKKCSKTGHLIPNPKYFEFFPERIAIVFNEQASPLPKPKSKSNIKVIQQIKSCGESLVMLEAAKQVGLLPVLQDCFPQQWEKMLACAFYFLSHGSSVMYMSDWCEMTKLDFIDNLDDSQCSRLFASISWEHRQQFFIEWVKVHNEQKHITFDVSSISTYSTNMEIAEYGYNRDNDNLPQINYGLFYGMTSGIPICYVTYSGSIPDKASMEYMVVSANEIGVKTTCFVVDGGFVTKDNITFMIENSYSFITTLPSSRKDAKDLIDKHCKQLVDTGNWINDYSVYGIKVPTTLYDKQVYAHIYFSPSKNASESETHFADIEKMKKELTKLNKCGELPARYKAYFKINQQSKNEFTFEVDAKKSNELLNRLGYFILFTDDSEYSSHDVIKFYREKNDVEQHFNQKKNGLDFRRFKTQSLKTTEGKIFIGFLALILRSFILKKLKKDKETRLFTFDKAMIELRKMQSVIYSDKNEKRTLITKNQKAILSAFNIEIKN
jgi:transposase